MYKPYEPCFASSAAIAVAGLVAYFGDKNFALGIIFLAFSGLAFLLGLTLLITSAINRLTEAINNKKD
jgi:disulfide bond formation protein DsbB